MSCNFSAELIEKMKTFGLSGVSPTPNEYQFTALPQYKPFDLTVL